MMPGVFVVSDNIFSPLGKTTAENFAHLKEGASGISLQHNMFAPQPYYAALFGEDLEIDPSYTKFEQLLINSITDALAQTSIEPKDKRTLLILSTTKGNISLLETEKYNDALKSRISLPVSADIIAKYFGFVNEPVVVSNACISGIMAIITGKRLIQAGQYDNVVVAGADVISKFVLSGFHAFQAVSPQPCRPFDADRDGITLGEGAATVILSNQATPDAIKVAGGAVSNDANHLSAPSRTGAELAQAIAATIKEAGLPQIDFISAHGTATLYNDEMEAKAVNLAGLQSVPLNSLKGQYGHTLGAAGLIESIVSMQSMRDGALIPTLGYKSQGTPDALNIYTQNLHGDYHNCLKIASGFGGCNAAVLFTKE
jgi:3-oxoacyl-[acyl-carrier-protein] synthase-1